MSFFVVVLSPPPKKTPEKTITSKFTNLHFNLFKLRVFTCMYVKLHNIACYYMYWIFFFLKHKQSLFSNIYLIQHISFIFVGNLVQEKWIYRKWRTLPLLKKNPPKLIHGILGASWKGILQKISLTKFWNWDVHVCLNKIFRVTRFWSYMYK